VLFDNAIFTYTKIPSFEYFSQHLYSSREHWFIPTIDYCLSLYKTTLSRDVHHCTLRCLPVLRYTQGWCKHWTGLLDWHILAFNFIPWYRVVFLITFFGTRWCYFIVNQFLTWHFLHVLCFKLEWLMPCLPSDVSSVKGSGTGVDYMYLSTYYSHIDICCIVEWYAVYRRLYR